jgi:hypothetical protein
MSASPRSTVRDAIAASLARGGAPLTLVVDLRSAETYEGLLAEYAERADEKATGDYYGADAEGHLAWHVRLAFVLDDDAQEEEL